ncbi:MAG: UTP--glucose-1-phosphate uridylyltransferase GalU [Rickettsiales bacterium]
MAYKKVKKVVFPVGGLGTRFLPATKSMPKEMLPVVDKPLIHYAFEEAKDAGIEEFIFVTGRNKVAIADYFDHSYELQDTLNSRNKMKELGITSDWIPEAGNVIFTRQRQPLGLGHAVWCARNLVGDEPFAVILADDLVLSQKGCLKQMVEQYNDCGGNILGVMDVPRKETARYGIVDIDNSATSEDGKLVKALGLVEKPTPEEAPSTLSVIGRYILQPEVINVLSDQKIGAGGEIQLTDAIASMIGKQDVFGYRFDGVRYDCGRLMGFVAANVAFALERGDVRDNLITELAEVYKRAGINN